jgi:dihydroorotate dehydrogenase electron transfer subunit
VKDSFAATPPTCSAENATAEVASGKIVRHERIAEGTWRLRVHAPRLATTARPGQFAMVRLPGRFDPLLARPLAVYETAIEADGGPPAPQEAADARYADFIYAVHGKFTQALSRVAVGESIEFWGPLGNGFGQKGGSHLLLVAGGIGQTALLALGKERLGVARYGRPGTAVPRADRVTLLWGCRTGSLFGDVEDFRRAGIDVHLATLDGSVGRSGTVVDLLDAFGGGAADAGEAGRPDVRIACCGPEGMMAAVSKWAARHGVPCEVSLETPMACGVGICFSCVAPVRDAAGGWDYRRTCIEGPVFDSTLIAW